MTHERIWVDPKRMAGKPCVRGTRIPVHHVLRRLGEGMTADQIVDEYPPLTLEDIRACQAYAADVVELEDITFASGT